MINGVKVTSMATSMIEHESTTTPDVCPDKFVYEDLGGNYPFFYKGSLFEKLHGQIIAGIENSKTFTAGFETQPCDDAPPFHTVFTLAFNFVHYSDNDIRWASGISADVKKLYPGVKILAAIADKDRDKFNTSHITKTIYLKTRSPHSVQCCYILLLFLSSIVS